MKHLWLGSLPGMQREKLRSEVIFKLFFTNTSWLKSFITSLPENTVDQQYRKRLLHLPLLFFHPDELFRTDVGTCRVGKFPE